MDIHKVKQNLGKTVYYDNGQMNFGGCSINDFILTACILRLDKKGKLYYQAELKEQDRNSVIIVPLEKVLTKSEV